MIDVLSRNGIIRSFGASLILATLSTTGDFLWAHFEIPHRTIAGILHGALLCVCMGAVLGYTGGSTRSVLVGAIGGIAVGVLSAASFYLLRLLTGFGAMIAAWMVLWVLAAMLHRWVGSLSISPQATLTRGVVAAVSSGFAFYAISGIWTDPPPGGPNLPFNFLCWSIAFLPGFLSLFWTLRLRSL